MEGNYYFDEIFKGLDKFPSAQCPGTMISTGDSVPLFAYPNSGDVLFTVCEYGFGKVAVFAHDCYLDWLHAKESDALKYKFMNNLKSWLASGRPLEESEEPDEDANHVYDNQIGNLGIIKSNDDLNRYKLLLWHHNDSVDSEMQQKILNFMENGGGLLCASTPWGYLQLNDKSLDDMPLYNFLKDNFGILYKSNYVFISDEIPLSDNKATHSNFDKALEALNTGTAPVGDVCHVIAAGLDELYESGFLNDTSITGINQKVENHCSCCDVTFVPSAAKALSDPKAKSLSQLMGKCFTFMENVKAPGIEEFPGDYEELPELQSQVELSFNTHFEEWLSTGYYLPAGVTLVIDVVSDTPNLNKWQVRVGAHSDDLSGCNTIRRWPCVSITKSLEPVVTLSSPYGGLIYIVSPSGGGSITVSLSNVVESPFYDLTKPETINDWQRRKNSPGLWAELAGKHIIFTTPSKCIRRLENPKDVLMFWDKVVTTHHECRGSNVNEHWRERVVNDEQPSAGYMHSGYPIMTHLDCCQKEYEECIFDVEKLRKSGCWGLFHELGHNMQRGEWTFDGCGEVTVNIFSMHANEFVVGTSLIHQRWPRDRINEFGRYFSKQPTYDDWKNNVGMALMTFAQLIKHFGWESMRKFMRDYEDDMKHHRDRLPNSNQDKIDQWVIRYSNIVSRNIKPQFEMFGLPVSSNVDEHVSHLPAFCPTEEKDPNIFFS